MKKIVLQLAILLLAAVTSMAQVAIPDQFNYQGIARTPTGSPLPNQHMSLRLSILDGSSTGTIIYQETFPVITNGYGLYNVAVGTGHVVSGLFSTINWGSAAKFLQVEIDPTGDTSYAIAGNSQLLSVPYALYAAHAPTVDSGTVKTITVGAGLGGAALSGAVSTITDSGSISLARVGTAATYGTVNVIPCITTDAYGRVINVTTVNATTGGTVTTIATVPGQLSGGPITTTGTLGLATINPFSTANFGSATQIPKITVDAFGRVSSASNITVSAVTTLNTTPGQLTGGPITSSGSIGLATINPTPGSYGSSTQIPQITTDAYGRITAITTATVSISGTANYLPTFTGANTVGNSIAYQTNSNMGVNTITPRATVEASAVAVNDSMAGWFYTGATANPPYNHGVLEGDLNNTSASYGTAVMGNAYPSAAINSTIGVQGLGTLDGVEGSAYSTLTTPATQVTGVVGSSYGDGGFSIGVAGHGHNNAATPNQSIGIYGDAVGGTTNYAGYFVGNVTVTGTLSASTKLFKIDDPADPANKYLYHSCVESNEMMNIYSGNVTTDASGNATVVLPSYFQSVNADFRYQLTVIGTFAQAIIGEKINNNQFTIKTNAPNVEVSWQVTAVRNDPYAVAHPIQAEVEKESFNKGKYLDPKDYGKTDAEGIGYNLSNTAKKAAPAASNPANKSNVK